MNTNINEIQNNCLKIHCESKDIFIYVHQEGKKFFLKKENGQILLMHGFIKGVDKICGLCKGNNQHTYIKVLNNGKIYYINPENGSTEDDYTDDQVVPLNVCTIKENIEKTLETKKTLLNLESIQEETFKHVRKIQNDAQTHLETLEKQKINQSQGGNKRGL